MNKKLKNFINCAIPFSGYFISEDAINEEIYKNCLTIAEECIKNVGGDNFIIKNYDISFYTMRGSNAIDPQDPTSGYINKIDFSPVYNLYNSGIMYGLTYKVLSLISYLFNKKKNKEYLDEFGVALAVSGGIVDASYGISLYNLPIKIWGEPLEKFIAENPGETKNIIGLITAKKFAFIGGLMVDAALAGYGLWRIIKKKRVMGGMENYKNLAEVLERVE